MYCTCDSREERFVWFLSRFFSVMLFGIFDIELCHIHRHHDEAKHNTLPLIVQPLHLLGPNKDVIVVFDPILFVQVERYRYNRSRH